MKKLTFTALLLLAFSGYGAVCKKDEVTVATCTLPKNKNAVICANQISQSAYYLFTKNGDEELRVQFDTQNPLKRWFDKLTYTTYFGFKQGQYFYRFIIPQENYGAYAMIDIHKNNKFLANLDCAGNSFAEKDITNSAITEVFNEDGEFGGCFLGMFCS